mmetsp:Transcript_39060/g.125578  ORF Transcript_39060/g.125578 Transcript_39060/m.125578 type:complete len:309 (+) Transcript_39060:1574-2500(+)
MTNLRDLLGHLGVVVSAWRPLQVPDSAGEHHLEVLGDRCPLRDRAPGAARVAHGVHVAFGPLQELLQRLPQKRCRILGRKDAFLHDAGHISPIGGVHQVPRSVRTLDGVRLHDGVLLGLEEHVASPRPLPLVHNLLEEPRPDHAFDTLGLPNALARIVLELHVLTAGLVLVDENQDLGTRLKAWHAAVRSHLVDHEDVRTSGLQTVLHDGEEVLELRAVDEGSAVAIPGRRGKGRELAKGPGGEGRVLGVCEVRGNPRGASHRAPHRTIRLFRVGLLNLLLLLRLPRPIVLFVPSSRRLSAEDPAVHG